MNKAKTAGKQAPARAEKKKEEGFFKETVKTVIYAVLLATVFRTFFYEPFNIPSESMLPTLLTGDYIFVSKMSYGYSRHSFPFSLGPFSGRVMNGEGVGRGDIAVFKLPRDDSTDYIKRVIGLPGDRLQMIDGVLHINGQRVEKEPAGYFAFEESSNMDCLRWPQYRYPQADGTVECRYPRFRETLPNGVSYFTLDLEPFGSSDNTGVFVVPEGHYFAMGDNRDNSSDSRRPISVGVGFVPDENLIGRATIIFFSTDGSARLWQFWKWYSAARWGRLFTGLAPE